MLGSTSFLYTFSETRFRTIYIYILYIFIIPVHLTVPDVLSSGYLKWTKKQSNNHRSGKQSNCGTVGGLVVGGGGGGAREEKNNRIEEEEGNTVYYK